MNSTIPVVLPPTSGNYCNLAGTSGGGDGGDGDRSFTNPVISSSFLLQRPPNPLFITGGSGSEAKSKAEFKSTHKEAERLRRLRINGHLATLRTLLPNLLKTDKASLLGEVVRRVRELKEATSHLTASPTPSVSEENLLPEDTDVVRVRRCDVNGVVVATLSCQDRPELLTDLSRALKSVKAKIVRVEIATVGGRTKFILRLQDGGGREGLTAVSRALKVVVDRPNCSTYAPALGLFGPKRQRLHR